jgi:O-antigen/teichoic acid export membrane protein
MLLSQIVYLLYSQSSLWLLAVLGGADKVAALGACMGVAGAVIYLSRGFATFLLPTLSSYQNESCRRLQLVTASMTIMGGVALCVIAASILYGDMIIAAIYSENYSNLGGVLLLCTIYAAILVLRVPMVQALHSICRTDYEFKSLLVAYPVSFAIGVMLIYKYGLFGACWSLIIGITISILYVTIVFRRVFSMKGSRSDNVASEPLQVQVQGQE